jgi:molybdopterin-containing oxidoreductase family membrane subunit
MSTGDVTDVSRDVLVRPLTETSKKYWAVLVVVLGAIGVFLVAYTHQLSEGLIVTNLGDWGSSGGVPWGLYIGAFIWWVGIAHGGIILSAAVRLIGLDTYQPVARMAELLTIAALSVAGLYIVVHVGRPDRLVTSVVPAWPWRVHWSPLTWDVTVITLYFVLTATYLSLTVRYDIHRLREHLPDRFELLYKLLLIGYTEREDEIVERMVWWVAFAIIILAPLLLHGGVIPWLFALLPSMAGWQGGVQGPTFLMIALTSAVSGIIIASAIFRYTYNWQELIPYEVFQGLAKWLGFFGLLFLWLQLQQVLNGIFAANVGITHAAEAKLFHPVYLTLIALVVLGELYILASALQPSLFSIPRIVTVSLVMLGATLTEKVLFVVEGLQHAYFDLYNGVPGPYFPSPVELASVLGTTAIVVLYFMIFAKVIPIVELHAIEDHDDEEVEA